MKKHPTSRILRTVTASVAVVTLTLVAGWLLGGCATSQTHSNVSRPGDGLREYRQLITDLRKATMASRESVQKLSAASVVSSNAAYARFDEALHRLEVDSIKARARTDAMEQRGAAYFDEWADEIAATHDTAEQRAAHARLVELRQHFDAILADIRLARPTFKEYLDDLRSLQSSSAVAAAKPKPSLESVIAAGQSAERQMDKLLSTVQSALAAVMAGPVKPVTAGGKS
jgi:hypothetical protein